MCERIYLWYLIIDVCEPQCIYGACVSNGTCFCSTGYEGKLCDTPGKSSCVFCCCFFNSKNYPL